ncbi:MAG: hypothetical protein QOH50_2560 [Kribbellaceae bacterium]|nr:hypothetical protein [Kribbellaceae bacterium]
MCGKVRCTCDIAGHSQYLMNTVQSVELVRNDRQCVERAQSGRILRGRYGYLIANDPGDPYVFMVVRKLAAHVQDATMDDVTDIF